jgi:hypothetical protein
MQVDPAYLRQHYSTLSDDALLAINRSDLVEVARKCYDDELQQRQLSPLASAKGADDGIAYGGQPPGTGEEPEWLDEASEVYSSVIFPGQNSAQDAGNAHDALKAEGIPCYLEMSALPTERENVSAKPTHQWRLLVPNKLNLRATSVLEKEIFNDDFEAEWKTLLEVLSDHELAEMNPQTTFVGLFDRIERVTAAYQEEVARRNQKA